jgi:hypothetical protein
MFENRKYVVIFYSDIDKIDFSQVLETSSETVRRSIDGTLTFVKYDGQMPSSIVALPSKSQELTHEEILNILATPEWKSNIGAIG